VESESETPIPIRARRITCLSAWRPEQESESTTANLKPVRHCIRAAVRNRLGTQRHAFIAYRWLIVHSQSISPLLLLSLILIATVVSISSSYAATSVRDVHSSVDPSSSSSFQPHILLLSIPWRSSVLPLRNLGQRLIQRGFHVSFGVSSDDVRQWIRGSGFDEIETGEACEKVRRRKEQQPRYQSHHGGEESDEDESRGGEWWDPAELRAQIHASQQAEHPGAELIDLFSPPPLWQNWHSADNSISDANDSMNATTLSSPSYSASHAPNGVSLLMDTLADYQSCMLPSLYRSMKSLLSRSDSDIESSWLNAKERVRRERKRWMEADRNTAEAVETAAAALTGQPAPTPSKRERDAQNRERQAKAKQLFPMPKRVGPPTMLIVDRFTFAAMDVAQFFNLTYVINNPHLLLDVDNPSWSLPTPWSHTPPFPPLTLPARVRNIWERVKLRLHMVKALTRVNEQRMKMLGPSSRAAADIIPSITSLFESDNSSPPSSPLGHPLSPLVDWSSYISHRLIFTNTIWGLELHRSSDVLGATSRRNAHHSFNALTPRFIMTGPLLPVASSALNTGGGTNVGSEMTGSKNEDGMDGTDLDGISIGAASNGAESLSTSDPSTSSIHTSSSLSSSPLLSLPSYSPSLFPRSLHRFISKTRREHRRLIYINLGDGNQLERGDIHAMFGAIRALKEKFMFVWSGMNKANQRRLLNGSDSSSSLNRRSSSSSSSSTSLSVLNPPPNLLLLPFFFQYEFLAVHASLLSLTILHASLPNVQDSFAAGLPILLLPHPTVDQMEVAARTLNTGAVYIVQKAQVAEESITKAVEKITKDSSYAMSAHHLASFFLPSSSQGTVATAALIEFVFAHGMSTFMPDQSGDEHEWRWYQDWRGFPLDLYALYAAFIILLFFVVKHGWHLCASVWQLHSHGHATSVNADHKWH